MSFIYVIMVYGLLHDVQAILPGSYPDLNTCKAALVQTHLVFPNWGQCEPLATKPQVRRRQG